MSSSAPETMKAWIHTRAGLPSQVLNLTTLPKPAITSPTQVLVKVSHCALNPAGRIVMQLLPFIFRGSPAIPEMDFSGTIVAAGPDVPGDRVTPGVQVFGSIPLAQHVKSTSGGLAEYIVLEHTAVVKKPSGAPLSEVAGLGIAGATALELIKAAKLKKGDSVLVNGASGGIGHLVMQMCRNEVGETGKVVAVCSKDNDWVKKYGADEVIDYGLHAPVHSHLAVTFGASRFSAVIDAVGIQDIFNKSPSFLAEGKPYVTVGPKAYSYTVLGMLSTIGRMAKNFLWPRLLGGIPREYIQVASTSTLSAMEELAKMVEDGTLKVHVSALVGMDSAKTTYESLLHGHVQGKIVVAIQDTK
ncbi:chaperonin 10-like protein [Pyrenochaeta sp. MPI-SDFR-AT-0127]|nr:chaperonin 10-like protein [Pyrenochaeta sp. MPI-SDFR-AT-0127]